MSDTLRYISLVNLDRDAVGLRKNQWTCVQRSVEKGRGRFHFCLFGFQEHLINKVLFTESVDIPKPQTLHFLHILSFLLLLLLLFLLCFLGLEHFCQAPQSLVIRPWPTS